MNIRKYWENLGIELRNRKVTSLHFRKEILASGKKLGKTLYQMLFSPPMLLDSFTSSKYFVRYHLHKQFVAHTLSRA